MCIDWNNLFSTLIGAGAGALGAYWFNLKQANKHQKETEKSKLLKLFYDISILIKVFVYHHENTVAEINNLTTSEIKSVVPITIRNTNFDIDGYGFITKLSPKLYEMLTYVHHDINYIYEQQDLLQYYNHLKKLHISTLEHIEVSTVKLLAKLYVSLININNVLIKNYKCKNLIKDEVVNAYIRAKKIIDKTTDNYSETLKDPQIQQEYDMEEIITIQEDLKYINEIINAWVIDLGLKKKQKAISDTEIEEQVKKKWEAPENDL